MGENHNPNLILFSIFIAHKVMIVPMMIDMFICSCKKIALKVIAEKGTKKIKVLTLPAPSLLMPIKYIVFE